ncbi:MAG TPA: restriction endonuclease subunit S [Chryseolinea sp.]|nr:restriction endonuclease subunit S [Chryseolinea sp.]
MTAELKQSAATGAPASGWKPYPAYKDSGVEWLGKVPEHWEVWKLKWVSNLIYGSSLSNDERVEGKVPVYGSNGIIGYHNQAISKKPCIIIGRKGSFGKINYSNIECFPIDTTYYIDETATKNNLLWLLYVLYTLNLDRLSKDSAVPGLSREDAYDKLILVPPLPEQRAISLYLDDRTRKIDSLIEKKQKMIELLKEERAAVINQAVTKGLNPDAPMKESGIEWLGEGRRSGKLRG